MISIVTILILLACVVLAFIVLIQNPKGGGLSGSFGNLGSQVMGVKQSTDIMEKSTWTVMGIIGALCIIAVMFYETPKALNNRQQGGAAPAQQQQQAPATGGQQQQQAPANQ
ncbi:MAG: preprotein translocase subunit SecG [Sphingobacteriales bacterium]|nr:MAG: preprotein translocase subunit SecG [Sphingobacteriales bacterium]